MQEMKLKSNGYGMLIGWTVWLIIVFVVMEVLNLVASRSNSGIFMQYFNRVDIKKN